MLLLWEICMFFKKNTGGIQWILVCLGNPGDKYENTRHNIGFMVADCLGEEHNKPIQKLKYKALTNQFTFGEVKVLVMKPITYMNLSGEAVREAADYYKVPPERILVVSDEVAFPVGKLKISAKGSAGGHNGLKNIIQHLGTDQFPRIRVGVGEKPHPDMDMADWVLGHFAKEDKIEDVVKESAKAVTLTITEGVDAAMAQCNSKVKGKGLPRKGSPEGKHATVKGEKNATGNPKNRSENVKDSTLPHGDLSGEHKDETSGGGDLS